MNARFTRALSALVSVACAACINSDRRLYEVDLMGEIVAPANTVGATTVELHHAETFGRGALAHPLGLIERVSAPAPGALRHTLLYPTDLGSGLVVYAWVDLNGDGQLCRPGTPPEPAGLAVVQGFPAHALSYRVELTSSCVGPEALFPR